jgi:hypothetical protein
MRKIVFRLIPLFAIVLSLLVPSAAPLAAQSNNNSVFGLNTHMASRYPEVTTLGTPASVAAESGIGWAREDFQLSRIAVGPGRYDWGFHDQAINELRSRNIQVIGLLNGPTPGWMSGRSDTQFVAPDPQAFATFAAAVVERYKDRISHWEIWNEPENSSYWQPSANPAAYAQLLIQASAAIKRVDPNAKVLSGGVVTPEPGVSFLTELSKHGAWNAFDIISVHAYVDPKTPEEGQIGAAGIGQVKALADRLGSKPIWNTEYGWATSGSNRTPIAFSGEDQANYLLRGAALMRAAGAERILWYNLKDDSNQHYGLVPLGSGNRDFGGRKPAYNALKTLNAVAGNHQSAQMLELNTQQMLLDFENFGTWRVGDQKNGTLTQSSNQVYGGSYAAQLSYSFNGAGNDYVVFTNNEGPTIAAGASTLSLWVYGDGSGHALKVWIRDANGEVLQFRLGFIGAPGWQRMSVPITGSVPSYDRISGGGNLQLDLPARLTAIVLDDEPDHNSTSGAIYLDDMTAGVGGESYGVRFNQGNQVVDMLWSPSGSRANIGSNSGTAQLIDRDGGSRNISASNGQFTVDLGPSPVYLVHSGGGAPAPAPAPQPAPPANQRCFPETGFCIGGRIREYWEQNGGLPVFGYPTSEQHVAVVEGREVQAQWFERNRLELHPENARPYDVLLGRLGAASLEQQGRDWQQFPRTEAQANCRFFPETGHNICGEFLQAWRANGLEFDGRSGKSEGENLALWGMPLSEAQTETTPDGKVLTVQWFERARFELHPDNQPPYRVLMGLLGNELRP